MDKELIERLAKEAKLDWMLSSLENGKETVTIYAPTPEQLGVFAALVAEECCRTKENDKAYNNWEDGYVAGQSAMCREIRAKFPPVEGV